MSIKSIDFTMLHASVNKKSVHSRVCVDNNWNIIIFGFHRNITMLYVGHVFGLEKPSAGGCESADTVRDFDGPDSGNAKMVYLKGTNEEVTKISTMAARQEHRYNRRIKYN